MSGTLCHCWLCVEEREHESASASRRGNQVCRNCGNEFPYSEDADYCPSCAAENAGCDDHSASRRVDVLQREAPHLLAPRLLEPADEPRLATPHLRAPISATLTGVVDAWTETTIVAALLHYGLACADRSHCVEALRKIGHNTAADGLAEALS